MVSEIWPWPTYGLLQTLPALNKESDVFLISTVEIFVC